MFDGRVVLITGAGKGIGKAAALRFSAQGASVVVAARNELEIEMTAAEITASGGNALAVVVDITDAASIRHLLEVTERQYGRLDVLINNAAVPGLPARSELALEDMSLEDWDFPFQVNVRGTMLCCQAALPLLRKSDAAAIVNVSSTAARRGMARRTHYCSSKAAVMGLTRALAWELGPQGIRVNCVVPGMTRTELLENLFQRTATDKGVGVEDIATAAAADAPMGALATPEQVADTMLFLASGAAAAMTGQALDPNMGSFMP